MQAPKIDTAIPKQRYALGLYGVVILGEIESTDPVNYRYILALVPEGKPDPELYVTCERTAGGDERIRVITPAGEKATDALEACADLDRFADFAIALVQQLMNLTDEKPFRLM